MACFLFLNNLVIDLLFNEVYINTTIAIRGKKQVDSIKILCK